MNLRNVTIGISCIILIGMIGFSVYITSFGGLINIVFGTLLFLALCGFPQIVSIMLSVRSKNPFSHITLMIASLLYGGWFAYIEYDAFFVNLDPQSGIAMIFIGVYALPVLLPLWIAAIVLNRYHAKQSEPQSLDDESEPDA